MTVIHGQNRPASLKWILYTLKIAAVLKSKKSHPRKTTIDANLWRTTETDVTNKNSSVYVLKKGFPSEVLFYFKGLTSQPTIAHNNPLKKRAGFDIVLLK